MYETNTNTNTNTNNLFPPIPSDTIIFIYDNYDNKYDNTMSYSCLLSNNDKVDHHESLDWDIRFTLFLGLLRCMFFSQCSWEDIESCREQLEKIKIENKR
jgi:hypothetical protein